MMQCLCGCGRDVSQHEGKGRPGRYYDGACRVRVHRSKQAVTKLEDNEACSVTKITNSILCGDALETLKRLPEQSVQMCVTSPPYYGLRNYGIDGQIGLEESPSDYIEKLVQVFREVRRVLKDDGTLWLNLGDSYAGSGKGGQSEEKRSVHWQPTYTNKWHIPGGFKQKDLMMIPARVAMALQSDGWYLRSDIVWSKGNAMPESVIDRPTKSYEHLFLLAKSQQYYYDIDAIREPLITSSNVRDRAKEGGWASGALLTPIGEGLREWNHPNGRNKRDVWTVNTQPCPEAHFAVMPAKLVEPCILAGSRTGDIVLDPFMGAGTVAMVALQHNRQYIGIELNPEYIQIANKRIATVQPVLWSSGEETA